MDVKQIIVIIVCASESEVHWSCPNFIPVDDHKIIMH